MMGGNAADQKITQQVVNKLSGRGVGHPCRVAVSTSNGEVTLSGTVVQIHQKKLAASLSSGIHGVRRVIDLLNVQAVAKRE